MVPFLLAAVASDGSVTFDSNAPAATDFWIGPQRYGAEKVFGTEDAVAGTDTRANGLRYTSEGVLRVYDATSAVPAGATTLGGFAVTSDGQLCVSTDAVSSATFVGGIAVRSDGAVFATGLSTPRSIADAIITALTPAAWYRNATDVVSSGGFASIWADYASTAKGLVLPNVSGNYASAPDSVPLSITGDIDIRLRLSLNDWTPSANAGLFAKQGGAGQLSFRSFIATTGEIWFTCSVDGTAATVNVSSTVAPTATNGVPIWLRITRNASTGKVNFYQADDSTSMPASWTQIGTEVSGAVAAIFDSTAALEIGACVASGIYHAGITYRAAIYSTIGGATPVFDADFSSQAIGTASFTESSSNAATVTINASGAAPAHIGKARDLLQGTGTNQPAYAAGVFTFDGADNFMKTGTFTLNQPEMVFVLFKQDAWASNDTIFDGNTTNSARLYQSTSSPDIYLYAGGGANAISSALAVGAYGVVVASLSGAASYIRVNNEANVVANIGTQNMGAFTLGCQGSTIGNYSNISVKEIAIFSSTLAVADVDSIVTALLAL